MKFRIAAPGAAAAVLCIATAHSAVIKQTAGPVQQVLNASDTVPQFTQNSCSVGFVNVPTASVRITLPPGSNQVVTVRFNASVRAGQSSAGIAQGAMRIVSGTHVFVPNDPNAPYFVASNGPLIGAPPIMLQRSASLAPGPHNIAVQYCVLSSNNDPSASVTVSFWQLTVEAAPHQ